MNKTRQESSLEGRSRRYNWTEGLPVILADEGRWRLPDTNLELMMTIPGLVDDLIKSYRLAASTQVAGAVEDEPARIIKDTLFHGRMIDAGIRLLRTNYDLPEDEWLSLIRFGNMVGAMSFSGTVARAVFLSSHGLIPRLATRVGGMAEAHEGN